MMIEEGFDGLNLSTPPTDDPEIRLDFVDPEWNYDQSIAKIFADAEKEARAEAQAQACKP
jgi:hypothetical protein